MGVSGKSISDSITILLKQKGLTQRDAAKAAGISYVTLNQIINYRRIRGSQDVRTRRTLSKLAVALGQAPDYFDPEPRKSRRVQQRNQYGRDVKEARMALRLSQRDLGEMVGRAQDTISQIESCRYVPRKEMRDKLNAILGTHDPPWIKEVNPDALQQRSEARVDLGSPHQGDSERVGPNPDQRPEVRQEDGLPRRELESEHL